MLKYLSILNYKLYFMANDVELKTETSFPKTLYISAWIFALVLILTIWLYVYNMTLESKIEKLNSEITTTDEALKKLNEDDKVKLYTLIKTSDVFLSQYKKLSKVTEFIGNLKWISKDYNLTFGDFAYSNSKITSSCTASNDDISLASDKVKTFIWDFRKKDNKNIFSLWFISSFSWQDKIIFNTEFKLK